MKTTIFPLLMIIHVFFNDFIIFKYVCKPLLPLIHIVDQICILVELFFRLKSFIRYFMMIDSLRGI